MYFPHGRRSPSSISIEYYVEVADAVLLHLRERPTVLKRYAGGIEAEPFYQKRVPAKRPDWIETTVLTFPSGRSAEELVPVDAAHLVWASRSATSTGTRSPSGARISTTRTSCAWTSTRRRARRGSRCGRSRLLARDVLAEHGLRGFPHTSGSRGMHIPVRDPPAVGLPDRAARGARAGARGRAPRGRRGDVEVVEGGASARVGVRRLQPERHATTRSRAPTACGRSPTRASRARSNGTRCADCEPGDFRLGTVPARLAELGDPSADIDDHPGSLDGLLALARRDEERGLGDAPWPPHFAKQPGEPKRVQPSRARPE